jgi:hypothetical protein
MSYSPETYNKLIDEEQKKVSTQIAVCEKVVDLLASPGWRDVVDPIIERTIIDVVGGKIGDVWVSGKLDRAKKEERREFYIGYKQALIDLHSRIMFHKQQLDILRTKMQQIIEDKQERYRVPLVDETRYKVEG